MSLLTHAMDAALMGPSHNFAEGDRVRARRRPQFPDGTVLRLMDLGFLLIRWDSNVLETAHYSELAKLGDLNQL